MLGLRSKLLIDEVIVAFNVFLIDLQTGGNTKEPLDLAFGVLPPLLTQRLLPKSRSKNVTRWLPRESARAEMFLGDWRL